MCWKRVLMNKGNKSPVKVQVLLLKSWRDEEGIRLGVLMLPNLDADLWDSNTNLVQEPQQSMIIDCTWGKDKYFNPMFNNMFLTYLKMGTIVYRY